MKTYKMYLAYWLKRGTFDQDYLMNQEIIIAQNEEGIYLIDQHAAQERINYEKYLKVLKEEKTTTVAPLFPINIELNPSDYIKIKVR